jgi:hypothetical protein
MVLFVDTPDSFEYIDFVFFYVAGVLTDLKQLFILTLPAFDESALARLSKFASNICFSDF